MDSQTTILQLNGPSNPQPVIKRTDHTTPNKMIYARSPSPVNGAQLKPNQVSTVLLYGIPIVSLYIEAQERLCLAQISNTLLKQFSYNEIHNRRVALGITCVQCTPVQLEILRRAGAMPVSSRRCGMITRREAERLCKSFLGDNSPPRLPDDFSFGVLHECAWGCRGAFLPSRYNSSRAKCIKCTFCGLFFSPNKFIFHSHRLGPNDKYVQPDAANFNSWRRHLKLSGNPPDDVAHAWEDVKAMFNGGTRKRMLSSPISMHRRNGSNQPEREAREQREGDEVTNSPPKRPKEVVPVVPKTPAHFPIRPINIHPSTTSTQQASTPSPVTPPNLANLALRVPAPTAATAFPQDLPFTLSRSFMIDYMWHQHHQQQQTISSTTSTPPSKPNQFQFPPYSALSWINKPPSSFLFKPNGSGVNSSDDKPTFNHFSAFKPVVNMRLDPLENSSANVLNNPNTQSPASSTSSYNHTTTSSTNHSDEELAPIKIVPKKRSVHRLNVDEVTNDHSVPTSGGDTIDVDSNCSGSNIKEHLTSDDENEMVDIETTEDDVHIHNLQPFKYSEDREVDEKCLDLENNNLSDDLSEATKLSKKHRASELIKSVQDEEYNAKLARRSPSFNNNNSADWSINLKKEVYFNPPYFNPFKSN